MVNESTHVVSGLQSAMTGKEASNFPAAGQSVHNIHLLSFLFASSPLTLFPSRSLAMHARSNGRIARGIRTIEHIQQPPRPDLIWSMRLPLKRLHLRVLP